MSDSLLTSVVDWLNSQRGSWPTIAREAGVDYSWMSKVVQGQIDDPGIKRIEKLGTYMRAMKTAA